jgi:hypothetical protein
VIGLGEKVGWKYRNGVCKRARNKNEKRKVILRITKRSTKSVVLKTGSSDKM